MRTSILAAALVSSLGLAAAGCSDSDGGGGGGGGGSGGTSGQGGSGGTEDPGPYDLTVAGGGYSPHTLMHAALYDVTESRVTVRLDPPAPIDRGNFAFTMTDALVAGHTYRLDRFGELAGDPSPGVCDPGDHRWSTDIARVTSDTTLTIAHNPSNFSDVACSSFED
jgi:hypothetical protein